MAHDDVCSTASVSDLTPQGQQGLTFWPPELVCIHHLTQGEDQVVHLAGCGHSSHRKVGATQQVGLHGALSRLGSVAVGGQAVVQGDYLRLGAVRLPLQGCQDSVRHQMPVTCGPVINAEVSEDLKHCFWTGSGVVETGTPGAATSGTG